ncbi:MAG: TOM core complex subunit Tom6 [Lasallia pustulata]|uniref:TOM core complex subunit Tom6 n=1 Tax=Lasallia pustulata TaxID=136370 RepID=A0A5M8Q037_9LECA|nr:MAG: TOM core complex subunit Tom6 [Lasallia pustulata]
MPPKPTSARTSARIHAQPASSPRGSLGGAWTELTAAENQSVVRAVAVFAVAVAFFASSWSEFLIPPV